VEVSYSIGEEYFDHSKGTFVSNTLTYASNNNSEGDNELKLSYTMC